MVELNHCNEVKIATATGKYAHIEIDNVLQLFYDVVEFTRLRDACNKAIEMLDDINDGGVSDVEIARLPDDVPF